MVVVGAPMPHALSPTGRLRTKPPGLEEPPGQTVLQMSGATLGLGSSRLSLEASSLVFSITDPTVG